MVVVWSWDVGGREHEFLKTSRQSIELDRCGKHHTHTIAGLNATISDRLHDRTLLIRYVSYPVGLACSDKHVGRPGVDMAIELVIFIDLEFGGILDAAALAVMVTIFSVNGRIDFGKQRSFRRFGETSVQSMH